MGNRTALFSRHQPGGVFTISELQDHPGDVYFVHSGTGTDAAGYGQNPDAPAATIDYAIGLCTASKGDTIYVLPGHAESVAAAAGIDVDVIGVRIIGLGQGTLRPTVTFTTVDTADIDIDAANCTIKGIRFVTDIASLVAPIDVNAAGFTLEDCEFLGNNAAAETNLITVITDANADDMTIRGCSFEYLATVNATAVTTTSTECIRLVGADRAVIEDNYISGDFTTSAINGISTASKDVRILRNQIHNIATENIAGVIDLVAACNGIIAHNYGFIGYAVSLAAVIDPSSCGMVENYFSNVVTEAAGLVGTAST